ncbi:hypothetical protein [Pseudomonas sp.]|uniref:hypothetical protein n=1 Tax=Pseudomonas sp. TaxID=306 RepID=UPI0039180A92
MRGSRLLLLLLLLLLLGLHLIRQHKGAEQHLLALLQVTGRSNYREAGAGLGLPLEDEPDLLEQAEHAAQSAAWWWAKHGLNQLADAGRIRDIGSIINTGQPGKMPHGAAERLALYDIALRVLA